MSLQSIDVGSNPQRAANLVHMSQHASEAKKSERSLPVAERADKHSRGTITADNNDDAAPRVAGDGDARGVIRLLEEGHFKGVADVRLRINNFDELASRANVAAGPVVEEQSHKLVATIEAQADELISTLAVEEDAQQAIAGMVEDFDAAVQAVVDDMLDSSSIDADALAGEIASLFDGLLGRLHELLAEPIPEPEPSSEADAVVDTNQPDGVGDVSDDPDIESPDETGDGVDAPPINYEDALASLRTAFDDALLTLLSSISSAFQLADPSPPNGHGEAYAKFLTIYNDLRGGTPDVNQNA